MVKQVLIAASLMIAAITAPATADDLFGGKPPAAPNPGAILRIHREGNLVWRGDFPSDVRPLESRIARSAWTSPAGKKAMADLGLSDPSAKAALKVIPPGGGGGLQLVLTLPSDTQAARDAGARFLDGLATQVVPDALAAWADEYNQIPVVRAEEALQYARKEFEVARASATNERRQIREVAEVLDPSPEAVRGATSRLEQERQRIQLELVGQNARLKALQERVAKLAETAAFKADRDPIAAELEKIVIAQEKAVARVADLQKQGGISAAEAAAAETQLAEARAKLLERRETAARSAGSELLTDLNKELITLSITIVENEARLEYVGRRLKGLAQATDLVDDLEQLQATANRVSKQLELAEAERQAARRQAAIAPAFSVSVSWSEARFEQIVKPLE
jgi:hypothetical protein